MHRSARRNGAPYRETTTAVHRLESAGLRAVRLETALDRTGVRATEVLPTVRHPAAGVPAEDRPGDPGIAIADRRAHVREVEALSRAARTTEGGMTAALAQRVDDRTIGAGVPGPITQKLLAAYRKKANELTLAQA